MGFDIYFGNHTCENIEGLTWSMEHHNFVASSLLVGPARGKSPGTHYFSVFVAQKCILLGHENW